MTREETVEMAELYRYMIAENLKEIPETDIKSLKGAWSFTNLLLDALRKKEAKP